jgi:hypothetical protein
LIFFPAVEIGDDGLESAKPDLQSEFKKPGGATAELCTGAMLRGVRNKEGLNRGERGCLRRKIAAENGYEVSRDVVSRRPDQPGNHCKRP